ncbi:MAG: AMP-binding protein, partial [Clostridia bacterium]|nr:AMP-binding protein [Clostridia bacterium]
MNSYNFMLNKFLPRVDFSSYEDFKQNYKLNIPDGFNFAYDVIDEWAKNFPEKRALIHYDDETGESEEYTFSDMSRMSNKAANAFMQMGIKKGDKVMLILRQRVEVWVSFLALHKIGAVCIPATFQLTPKDIVYRCESAGIKMICTVDQPDIIDNIKQSVGDCKTLEKVCVVGENIPDGMVDLRKVFADAPEALERIPNHINDPMLMY